MYLVFFLKSSSRTHKKKFSDIADVIFQVVQIKFLDSPLETPEAS